MYDPAAPPDLLPKGAVSGLTDFAKPGYGGPVPILNSGFHPYLITVYALNATLELDARANPALVGFIMGPLTIYSQNSTETPHGVQFTDQKISE